MADNACRSKPHELHGTSSPNLANFAGTRVKTARGWYFFVICDTFFRACAFIYENLQPAVGPRRRRASRAARAPRTDLRDLRGGGSVHRERVRRAAGSVAWTRLCNLCGRRSAADPSFRGGGGRGPPPPRRRRRRLSLSSLARLRKSCGSCF